MKARSKRILSGLLCLCMVLTLVPLGALPTRAEEATTQPAYYIGTDSTTKGAWEGAYGTEAAILYGYSLAPTNDEITAAKSKTGDWGYYFASRYINNQVFQTTDLAGSTNRPGVVYIKESANSSFKSISANLSGNNMFCYPAFTQEELEAANLTKTATANLAASDAAVLNWPSGVTGSKYLVHAVGRLSSTASGFYAASQEHGNNTRQAKYTLTMEDTAYHVVSIYAYANYTNSVYIHILDANGQEILVDEIKPGTFTNGAYVSYLVPGSVTIYVTQSSSKDYSLGISGIFVDPVLDIDDIDLSAAAASDGGAVNLAWSSTGLDTDATVTIERQNGDTWETVTTVAASTGTYTHTDLAGGTTYTYRAYVRDGVSVSVPTASVSCTTPAFTDANQVIRLGLDKTTSGSWEGKYGSEIYSLWGYDYIKAPGNPDKIDIAFADLIINKDTVGSARVLIPHNSYDLTWAKDGLSYSMTQNYNIGGNIQAYAAGVRPSASAVLAMPASVTDGRVGFEVVAASSNVSNSPTYKFAFSDSELHILSLYSDYGGSGNATITITDTDTAEILLTETISQNEFANGGYVSYLLSGKVTVTLARSTGDFSFSGVFVDPLLDNTAISGLTVAEGTAKRSAKLTWTETGLAAGSLVQIERQTADGDWEVLTTVDAGVKEYTDTSLQGTVTYTYRLRTLTGTVGYSASCAAISYTVPPYTATTLTLDTDAYTADGTTVEDTVTVKATLINNETGNPISGQTVALEVDFGHTVQKVTGSITDENGVATITFVPEYYGAATVTAIFDNNDEQTLARSTATASLYVGETAWEAAPVLWNISDGILPGNLISLNGYGMDDVENLKVYYTKHTTDDAVLADPTTAATLEIINSDATYGCYVVVQLPENAESGLYDLWVANSHGTSNLMVLNVARPLFMDEYEAWNGQTIMISGRNLQGSQFGLDSTTKVRLVNGDTKLEQTVTTLSPYSLRFTVNGTAGTTYTVEVSNDSGNTWRALDSAQTLTVVAEGDDPLGIGVAWMDHFNWDNEISVLTHGAIAGDGIDDTAAFQSALDAAGAMTGGGVVYIPDGEYLVGNLVLPAYTVLLGESTDNTVLYYYNPTEIGGGGLMLSNTDGVGHNGFANFAIRLYDDDYRPDTFFWLGHAWGTANKDQKARTASEFFLSGIDLQYTHEFSTQRGLGMVYLADERVIVQNTDFIGAYCNTQSCYANEYVRYIGNFYDFDQGAIGSVALYNFVIDCTINDSNRYSGHDNHGFMMRQTTHWENCWVEGVGRNDYNNDNASAVNDGEGFCVEMPNGFFYIGQVVDSAANTITAIFPDQDFKDITVMYGRLAVTITSGKGTGQQRDIESIDYETGLITLTEAWDVMPDATSKFTITLPLDRATVYNCGVADGTKGIFMYGNGYDNVVANNYLEGTEGIFIYSSDVLPGRCTPNYFTTVRENVLNGIGYENKYVNIGVRSNRPQSGDGSFFNHSIYGIEVRNNIIIGDNSDLPTGNDSEAPIGNGLVASAGDDSSAKNTDGVVGDNMNIIWENNNVQHVQTGITTYLGDYGFVYKGNVFNDVATVYDDKNTGEVANNHTVDLESAPAVSKAALQNYVSLYKSASQDAYSADAYALLQQVIAQAETILADAASTQADYGFAMNRLRIAASLQNIPLSGQELTYILTTEEAPLYSAEIASYSATLNGTISLDFYFELSEDLVNTGNVFAAVTLPDMEQTTYNVQLTADMKTDDGYKFTFPVAAKEMTGAVTVQLFALDGSWNSKVFEYTVQAYAKKLIALAESDSTYADAVPVVKAMLNYGAAAQNHFGYNLDNLANSILSDADKTVSTFGDIDYSAFSALPTTDASDTVDFVGATLMLESETGLRLYLNVAEGTTVTAALEGTVPASVTLGEYTAKSGNGYTGYIEISGIAAKDLDEVFTVKVTASDDSVVTVQHSPMKYSLNVQNGSYAVTLQDLLAALYDYNAAANTYFN